MDINRLVYTVITLTVGAIIGAVAMWRALRSEAQPSPGKKGSLSVKLRALLAIAHSRYFVFVTESRNGAQAPREFLEFAHQTIGEQLGQIPSRSKLLSELEELLKGAMQEHTAKKRGDE